MDYDRGDRVRILGKPEWGPGLIQERSRNGKVRVVFSRAGEKTLSLSHAKLFKVVQCDAKWFEERSGAVQEWDRRASETDADGQLPPGGGPELQ